MLYDIPHLIVQPNFLKFLQGFKINPS